MSFAQCFSSRGRLNSGVLHCDVPAKSILALVHRWGHGRDGVHWGRIEHERFGLWVPAVPRCHSWRGRRIRWGRGWIWWMSLFPLASPEPTFQHVWVSTWHIRRVPGRICHLGAFKKETWSKPRCKKRACCAYAWFIHFLPQPLDLLSKAWIGV